MPNPEFEVEEIDHTADWAIRVRAPDVRRLFVGAATGMFGLLCDLKDIASETTFEFELESPDAETLLVDWLNELLYEAESRRMVFARFVIDALDEGSPARLRGRAHGGVPPALAKAIKAATFSGLRILADPQGREATLVFDV